MKESDANARRPSVCMVTQAVYPDVLGGSPVVVHLLADALQKKGVQVTLHTVDYGRGSGETSYRLVRHPRLRGPWDLVGTLGNPIPRGLGRTLAKARCDLIHAHSHLFFTSWVAARLARRRGIPFIVTVHGVRARRGALVNGMQEVWMRTLGKAILSQADRVICLNPADADEVRRYGARETAIARLDNPIRTDLFRPAVAGRQLAPQILWYGRHVAEKDVDSLIEAWGKVRGRWPNHRLIIVGNGPTRAASEDRARRLGDVADFRDALPQEKLAELLRGSGLFVLPSRREGQPLALIEAMAAGVPVVSTIQVPCLPDDAFVPPGDPQALAVAIDRVLSNGQAVREAHSRAAEVRDVYGPDRVAQQTESLYRDVLAEHAP